MQQMVEQFDRWVQQLGALGYVLLGLAALLEYVVPPFPGDTVMLLGGAYAVRGERSVVGVFVAVTLGSVAGLAIMYGVGRLFGSRVAKYPRVMAAAEALRDRASWLLLANRFFPTFRAVLFIAAGSAKMPFGKVLLLGASSAMAWNVLMIAIGYAVGGNAEKLTSLFAQYNRIALILLGMAVLVVVVRFLLKRKRA